MPVVDKRTPPSRKQAPSAAQHNMNENRADAAAKTQANKEKVKQAAARKAKRSKNDAQAATLQDTTNTTGCIGDAGLSPEEEIAHLTARLKSADAQVQSLSCKNKKLSKSIRQSQGASNADTDVTPIPKPKGKFKLQETMGLLDNRALFTKVQAGIHVLTLEAKIDFKSSWSQQEPGTVAKILQVAEECHPYLSANVRTYNSGLKQRQCVVLLPAAMIVHPFLPMKMSKWTWVHPRITLAPPNDPPSVNDEAPVASHSGDDDDDDKSEKWGGFLFKP
ncbi:hypothetical protein B0H17DRAFT_1195203 [Mycena rosella]|uniref:Uncharacterized protein n=1 Tax=Mycena rosella TaxID=1033263 RepID=A0AAD7GMA4_MYCRO|nr:hypothetical protein B0H17DRAFT_1195203 [Mycena rosella]